MAETANAAAIAAEITRATTADNLSAPLASPTFTGTTTLGDSDFATSLVGDLVTVKLSDAADITYDRVTEAFTINIGVHKLVLDPVGDGLVVDIPGAVIRLNESDTYINYPVAETMGLVADGLERMRVDTDGVTITTPGAQLFFGIGGPLLRNPSAGLLELDSDFQVIGETTLDGGVSATLPTFADNAAAITGGLAVTAVYQTATGELRIVV